MKSLRYLAALVIGAFVLSMTAFASDSHSGTFTLMEPVQVGSTQLAPGHYKAEWNGPENNLKVEIVRYGKTVLTTQGKIQDLPKPAAYGAVITTDTQNNTKQLDEIEFNNSNQALVLTGE